MSFSDIFDESVRKIMEAKQVDLLDRSASAEADLSNSRTIVDGLAERLKAAEAERDNIEHGYGVLEADLAAARERIAELEQLLAQTEDEVAGLRAAYVQERPND